MGGHFCLHDPPARQGGAHAGGTTRGGSRGQLSGMWERVSYDWSYSCNNITTNLIQISRLFYFGIFSKTNHQMII